MSEGAVETPEPTPTQEPASGGLMGGGTEPSSNGEVWSSLPEDLRGHPVIQNTKDLPTLAKRLIDSQSEIGRLKSSSIQPLGADATEKDIAQLWNALGRPENKADFQPEVKVPDGLPVEDQILSGAKELLYDNGLAPWQAERVMNGFLELQAEQVQSARGNVRSELQNNVEALQSEWGDEFEARLKRADRTQELVMEAAGFEDVRLLANTVLPSGQKFGDTPAYAKLFDTIASRIGEDTLMPGEETHKTMSIEEAQRKLDEYTNENITVLMDKGHPMHDTVQKERTRLNEIASGPNAHEAVIEADW